MCERRVVDIMVVTVCWSELFECRTVGVRFAIVCWSKQRELLDR